jgi:hypothetical protein
MKLYFVGLDASPPHELDFSRVFCFDVADRAFSAHTPVVLGGVPVEAMLDPAMRIR